jgi:hypothetical protein
MYATVVTVPAQMVYAQIPARELRQFVDGMFPGLAKNQIADATVGFGHRYIQGHDLLVDVPKTFMAHGPNDALKHFGHIVCTDFPTKAGIPIPGFSHNGLGPILESAGISRGWLNVSMFDSGVGILCISEGSIDLAQAIAGNLGMNWKTFFDTFAEGGVEIALSLQTSNPLLLAGGIQNILAGLVGTWNELTTYVDPLDFFGSAGISTVIGFVFAYKLFGQDLSAASRDAIRSGTIGALYSVSSAFGVGALAAFVSYRLGEGLARKHNIAMNSSLSINENGYRLLVDEVCKGNIPTEMMLQQASLTWEAFDNAPLLNAGAPILSSDVFTFPGQVTSLNEGNMALVEESSLLTESTVFLPEDPLLLKDIYMAALC